MRSSGQAENDCQIFLTLVFKLLKYFTTLRRQSLDARSSSQMQHRATLGHFLPITSVFSLLFWSAGFGSPLLNVYYFFIYITLYNAMHYNKCFSSHLALQENFFYVLSSHTSKNLKGSWPYQSDMPSFFIPVATMGERQQINNSNLQYMMSFINYYS